MDIFLNWLWQGSLVALAAQGSLRLLDRSRGAHRYTLCAAALMTVLVLPLLPLVMSGVTAAGSPHAASGGSGTVRPPAVALPVAWWTSDVPLAGLWLAWVIAHAVRLTVSLRALRVARRRCLPLAEDVVSRLRWWRDVSRRGRAARLVVSPDVASAAMLGGAVPAIAIAPVLVDRLADDDLDRVVIHEWAHVQRRDDLLTLMQQATRAVAGWHPAIWWLERQMHIEREAACDEIVVSIVGAPKAYAASLAAVASATTAGGRSLWAPGVLQASNLRVRVRRVLEQPRLSCPSRSWSGMAAAALLLALLAWVVAGFPAVAVTSAGAHDGADRVSEGADLREPTTSVERGSVSGIVSPRSTAAAGPDRQPPRRAAKAGRSVPDSAPAGVKLASAGPPGAEPSRRLSAGIVASAPEAPRGVLPPREAAFDQLPERPHDGRPSRAESSGPWQKIADTGASVGRGSARAGTATAGAFSRFGRRIANVF